MCSAMAGRSSLAAMTASTEPTSTARWMEWMASNSAARADSFSARTEARTSASSLASSAFFSGSVAAATRGLKRGDARVGGGAGVDLAGEHDRRGGRAADDGGERALDREHGHVLVERLGEHDERAAVVAGDHAEHDLAVEVDDGAADLGAVLELQAAHRLGRAVEAGQVRQHHHRPAAGGGVDRARDLLARQREQRARGERVGAVGRREAAARHRAGLDADQARPASRRSARPRRPRSPPRPCRPSAPATGGPGRPPRA